MSKDKILLEVQQFIEERDLFNQSHKLLVGVSGGLDSMVLVHILKALGFTIGIGHVNYHLRGSDSDKDQELVQKIAAENGFPFHLLSCESEEMETSSLQENARNLRYNWFNELVSQHTYNFILTAHHKDDSLETILMNFFRGSSPRGLSGISPKRDNLRRPLLTHSKEELLEFAQNNNLEWREDATNLRSDYNRNFIRHDVVPIIEKRWPGFKQAVLSNAETMRENEILKDFWVQNELSSLKSEQDGFITLNLEKIRKSLAPLTLLREALENIPLEKEVLRDILQPHQSGTEWLSNDLRYRFIIEPGDILSGEDLSRYTDFVPVKISEGTSRVKTDRGKLKIKSTNNFQKTNDRNVAILRQNKLKFPLILRSWKAGDVFHPQGMYGNKKKVKSFLTDLKLGKRMKEKVLVLCSEGEIVWVVGYRTDERFAVKDFKNEENPWVLKWSGSKD